MERMFSGYRVDASLLEVLKKLEAMGYRTKASCSGLRRDHRDTNEDVPHGFIVFQLASDPEREPSDTAVDRILVAAEDAGMFYFLARDREGCAYAIVEPVRPILNLDTVDLDYSRYRHGILPPSRYGIGKSIAAEMNMMYMRARKRLMRDRTISRKWMGFLDRVEKTTGFRE